MYFREIYNLLLYMKISKSRQTLLLIVVSYFVISSLYIIFSDIFLLYLFQNDTSNTLLHEIQSYKGIAFILLTALILFSILKKRDAITEKHIHHLKNNKLKYNNLFMNMLHGVVYTTTDGLILAANKAFIDILDTTEEQIIGQSIYSPIWKPIRGDNTPLEPFENPIKIGIETKKPVRDEIIGFLNPKTDKCLWLKFNSVLEFNTNNKEPYRVLITVDDITSLKNTQDELEKTQKEINESLKRVALSEFLLKEANTMAKIGVYEINSKNDSMHFSDEMYNIFNIPLEQEYPLEATRNAFKKQSKILLSKVVEECMEKGIPFDVELEIELSKKQTSWARLKGKPIYDEKNKIIGRRGILQDITDSKKAQLELELSKNKLQDSLELVKENEYLLKEAGRMANIGYWGYDKQTDTISWSNNLHQIYGTDPKEDVPDINMILSVFNEESRQRLIKATLNLTNNGVPYEIELQMTNFKNEKRWLRNIGEAIYNDKNEIIGRRGVSQDITQWILAKKEIQEYQASLQKLTTEITLIEEKQKKEIATNIHDHLSQSLVISRMRISEMKKKPELKKINEDLLFLETHIYEALENSRKITYELSPPVLYQLGIIDALNWFLDNTETTHKIKCQISSNTTDIKFSDVKSILLYRSIQEIITNIIKYANASLITLDINKNKHKIDFLITDNGVGFDASILNKQHHNHTGSGFGLFTVKERIKNIQGEFSLKSGINTGTIVKIIVPLTE